MRREYVVIDFETYSACELKSAGAEVYARDPSTGVHCLAYQWPTGPVHLWRRGDPLPADLNEHVEAGRKVVAHNAAFELSLWNETLRRDRAWPPLQIEQLDDTMARARAMSLPGSLEECAEALRLPVKKDSEGARVMMQLARPRSYAPVVFWTPGTAPEKFERLYSYCKIDVEVQHELHKRLPQLRPSELKVWQLAETINQRGVALDIVNVDRALKLLTDEKHELSAKVYALTGGASSATTRDKLLAWLQSEGAEVDSLKKADVLKLLSADGLDANSAARKVVELRREAAKGSTAKLVAMRRGVCSDSRARGLFTYHGAGTGRFAGRRIQTQNMPRPSKGFKPRDAECVISWLRFGAAAKAIRHEYDSCMDALSWSLRSFIVAPAGSRFICADFANIEGRVLAWLAGEKWKVEAFRDYDTPYLDAGGCKIFTPDGEAVRVGADLYKLAYSKSFGVSVESITDDQRQIGKVQELALGFQGGIGSFISMGANYGVVPEQIAAAVKAVTPADLWEKTLARCPSEKHRLRYGLASDVWTGLRVVVDSWRLAHPNVVKLWHMLEAAAIEAVEQPGAVTCVGQIKYKKDGDFLMCRLPSGRCLSYPYAEMRRVYTVAWEDRRSELEAQLESVVLPDQPDEIQRLGAELKEHLANPQYEMKLGYWGISSRAGSVKKWRPQRAYGGLLAENVTQAVARDVLVEAMGRCESRRYPVVMHVHDEVLTEVPDGFGSVEELCEIMCEREAWTYGLPIAAAGWSGMRYRK